MFLVAKISNKIHRLGYKETSDKIVIDINHFYKNLLEY